MTLNADPGNAARMPCLQAISKLAISGNDSCQPRSALTRGLRANNPRDFRFRTQSEFLMPKNKTPPRCGRDATQVSPFLAVETCEETQ